MKNLLLLALTFFTINSSAQFLVSPGSDEGEFNSAELAKIKSTTTLFVYRNDQAGQVVEMEKILKEVWTITPFKLVSFKEQEALEGNYSVFMLAGMSREENPGRTPSRSETTPYAQVFYELRMKAPVKGKKPMSFARVMMFAKYEDFRTASFLGGELMPKFLNEEAKLHNAGLGYFRTAVQFVNNQLVAKKAFTIMDYIENKEQLSQLANTTLYIPEYVTVKIKVKPGNYSEDENWDMNELMAKYPYKWKALGEKEMEELLLNSTEPVYYLSFVRASFDKFVTVYNNKTGEPIYSEYSGVTKNLKDSDLLDIAKASEK